MFAVMIQHLLDQSCSYARLFIIHIHFIHKQVIHERFTQEFQELIITFSIHHLVHRHLCLHLQREGASGNVQEKHHQC